DAAATHLSRWKDGESRDLHQEMGELTLDIVAKALFGAKVGHVAETIGEEVEAVMERFFTQAALHFLIPDKFPIPKTLRLMRSKRRLDEIVLSIIRERRGRE